jgi:hypothetical protein
MHFGKPGKNASCAIVTQQHQHLICLKRPWFKWQILVSVGVPAAKAFLLSSLLFTLRRYFSTASGGKSNKVPSSPPGGFDVKDL